MTINAPNVKSSNGIDMKTPPISKRVYATVGPHPCGQLFVVCVCHGLKYGDTYVRRLRDTVARHLPEPHTFVCLSDRRFKGIDTLPLHDMGPLKEGWWYKVQLFQPNLFPPGARILYLDLDVVVTGKLDKLVSMQSEQPLTMVHNFGPNWRHCMHNSSVMLWRAGDKRVDGIYNLWTPDVAKHLHGDQCWMWRVLREQIANFPQKYIQSYKYDVRPKQNEPSNDARVVVFHGEPKPEQVAHLPFVRENWIMSDAA